MFFSVFLGEALGGAYQPISPSAAFYTSRYGYKMCLRIYLNGDGTGRGTHLSLFFVVMKGPNDALLRWPFNQKVCGAIPVASRGPWGGEVVRLHMGLSRPLGRHLKRPAWSWFQRKGCGQ